MKWRYTKQTLNHTAASRGSIAKLLATVMAVAAGPFLASTESGSAHLNETVKPQAPFPNSAGQLIWDTLRAHFRLTFTLDPSAAVWNVVKREHPQMAGGEYESGPYRLKFAEKNTGNQTCAIRYDLTRTDGQPFRMLESRIECKTSYSGIYKIFNPSSFSQQSYKIDLPFRISGESRAEIDQPVIWMQQTDGHNTLTLGLLDQVPVTTFEGSTYDTANGGEAPGIANSYVRVSLTRSSPNGSPTLAFNDALYVNANPDLTWFEALEGYSAAVDASRGFTIRPLSQWALNPMWHSWYAHADRIDEVQIRDDARRARDLGVTTIELDAGWNMPREAGYSFDNEGDYDFDPGRFPNAKGMIDAMHAAGQRAVLHVAPLLMGKNSRSWARMNNCLLRVGGKPDAHLDPRLKQVHDYLLASWEHLFTQYGIDGLWYDFLELPAHADPPPPGMAVVSPDLHVAYTQLMQALYDKSLVLNPNAVIILRRPSANLNSKTCCTHVWPADTPQDYNMNRRDIVYMKTFGPGVLTHACCTSWAITESDANVARQMASIVLAGVPAFSVKLAESPPTHDAIVKAWLAFYEANKRDLVLGRMTPLLPTPPSAALRIEADQQAFFGFFEALPGLIEITKPVTKVTLVNAFSKRTATRLEGVRGTWQAQVYDQAWQPAFKMRLKTDATGGLNLNLAGPSECHAIVLTKRLRDSH
jgi:Glycosyl hydrolases family 31